MTYRIAGNFHVAEILRQKFSWFSQSISQKKICSHENFFLQKLFADDELRKPSTLLASNSTKNWPMLSWKHQANAKSFATNTQLACRHHNCEWILGVSSLPFAYRQRPTRFDKCGNLLLSFWCWNTHWVSWQGHRFHAWNCRRCGQTLWA